MTGKKTILIAEDDFAIADVIRMVLEAEGYLVRHMSDGRHILDMEDNLPDLLLLDIRLGRMDGREICRQLRANNFFDKMRIVLVSAVADLATLAADICADDFISKPFNITERRDKIEINLAKQSQ